MLQHSPIALFCLSVLFAAQGYGQNRPLSSTFAVKCIANQRYSDAEGKAGLCDVYLPSEPAGLAGEAPPSSGTDESETAAQRHPVVVIVHGGAWMTGDKWTLEGYSRLLASHGFVAVTINYRLAPEHLFPCQIDDVRQALIWTAQHADEFAIDMDRLGLFGYSAGGHLSALLGLLADETPQVQQQTSNWSVNDPRWQQIPHFHAVCVGGPPCDFRDLPIDNTGIAYFLGGSRRDKPDVYAAASPAAHVSPGDPPLQFIHGEEDFMVPIASSRNLYDELKKLGRDVRFKSLPGKGHMMGFLDPQTRQTMLRFFQSVFVKPKLSVWDMRELSTAPVVQWMNQEAPIRELVYQGQAINGNATDVFAFYATPGSIAGDPALDKDLPAVVLVHGGGGTAFAPWVWLWANRGYAAIAMDLSGRRPPSPAFVDGELVIDFRGKTTRIANGGPEQGSSEKFASVGDPLDDDWPYHAVGNVVRAHSLIRSFPEINAERTAITGISWGGYTTCIAASVDDRFKAAVPVYGCGFLYDGESVQRNQIDALSKEKRAQWIRQYDPSSHLPNCQVPILFVNGTNDKHYPLRSYSHSFALVEKNKSIRIEPNMKHSHQAGWAPKEIGIFIDSKLRNAQPLHRLGVLKRQAGQLKVHYTSATEIKSATLNYTTEDGPLLNRKWKTAPATVDDRAVTAKENPEATISIITVTDERDAMISTDVLWGNAKGGENDSSR